MTAWRGRAAKVRGFNNPLRLTRAGRFQLHRLPRAERWRCGCNIAASSSRPLSRDPFLCAEIVDSPQTNCGLGRSGATALVASTIGNGSWVGPGMSRQFCFACGAPCHGRGHVAITAVSRRRAFSHAGLTGLEPVTITRPHRDLALRRRGLRVVARPASTIAVSGTADVRGGVSRAAKGADCKSAGYAFVGSSPTSPTTSLHPALRGCSSQWWSDSLQSC